MAKATDSTGVRTIAEWVGDETTPRIDGITARELTQKDMMDGVLMETTRDLRWGPETSYRADISAENQSFKDWLAKDASFKITEE